MYSYRGTRFAITPLTLLLIASMPGATVAFTASASMEFIRVYSAIAVSVCINIVYKWVAELVKGI